MKRRAGVRPRRWHVVMKAAGGWYGMCQVGAAVHASLTPLAEVIHNNVGGYQPPALGSQAFKVHRMDRPPV